MKVFKNFTGLARVLPFENIDTDQIFPARFMKETRKPHGYGAFLLHDFLADKAPLDPQTKIILAGRNFGSGSSREAAVYALVDFGVCAVIAPSFGDIFMSNAFKNGFLAIVLPQETITKLHSSQIHIDLENQFVTAGDISCAFEIEDGQKQQLLQGLDELAMTLLLKDEITAFAQNYHSKYPISIACAQGNQ